MFLQKSTTFHSTLKYILKNRYASLTCDQYLSKPNVLTAFQSKKKELTLVFYGLQVHEVEVDDFAERLCY